MHGHKKFCRLEHVDAQAARHDPPYFPLSFPPVQVSEVLSRLSDLHTDVAGKAARRAPLVAAVSRLEDSHAEVLWLADYEVRGKAEVSQQDGRQAGRVVPHGRPGCRG